jgi:hypothetical protein
MYGAISRPRRPGQAQRDPGPIRRSSSLAKTGHDHPAHDAIRAGQNFGSRADGLDPCNPLECGATRFRATLMSRYLLLLLLLASPAAAQVKSSKSAAADPCAPIGRTADGKLVYSMKCETLPAPPAPPPQAELKETPAPAAEPEPEVRRSGIFGWSYDRR